MKLLGVLLFMVGGYVLPVSTQLGSATYEASVLDTPPGVVCPAADQLEMTRKEIRSELLVTNHEHVYHHPLMNMTGGLVGLELRSLI